MRKGNRPAPRSSLFTLRAADGDCLSVRPSSANEVRSGTAHARTPFFFTAAAAAPHRFLPPPLTQPNTLALLHFPAYRSLPSAAAEYDDDRSPLSLTIRIPPTAESVTCVSPRNNSSRLQRKGIRRLGTVVGRNDGTNERREGGMR